MEFKSIHFFEVRSGAASRATPMRTKKAILKALLIPNSGYVVSFVSNHQLLQQHVKRDREIQQISHIFTVHAQYSYSFTEEIDRCLNYLFYLL